MTALNRCLLLAAAWAVPALAAQGWTPPVEVRHDDALCLSYRARLDGDWLVVQVSVEPGWHTFAMDNNVRSAEKLAGRKSLGVEQPTEIRLAGSLHATGPWYQSPPRDFSRPELRWFSWGFDKQAILAVKVHPSSPGLTRISIRGQACTEKVCRNIDVTIPLSPENVRPDSAPKDMDLSALVQVKTAR